MPTGSDMMGIENSSGSKYLLLLEICCVLHWRVKALGISGVSAASVNTSGKENILSSYQLGDSFHLSEGKALWEQDTEGRWWCSDGERTLKWVLFERGVPPERCYDFSISPRSGYHCIGVPFRGAHFFPSPTSSVWCRLYLLTIIWSTYAYSSIRKPPFLSFALSLSFWLAFFLLHLEMLTRHC